jgi:hypothetical protein
VPFLSGRAGPGRTGPLEKAEGRTPIPRGRRPLTMLAGGRASSACASWLRSAFVAAVVVVVVVIVVAIVVVIVLAIVLAIVVVAERAHAAVMCSHARTHAAVALSSPALLAAAAASGPPVPSRPVPSSSR